MMNGAFVFGVLISLSGEIQRTRSQPDGQAASNGFFEPAFNPPHAIYGIRHRTDLAIPNDELLPPRTSAERNYLVSLIQGMADSAEDVGVFELFENERPQRETVVGFLCRVPPNNQQMLLHKDSQTEYNRITFGHVLTGQDVLTLEEAEVNRLLGQGE